MFAPDLPEGTYRLNLGLFDGDGGSVLEDGGVIRVHAAAFDTLDRTLYSVV